jgi:lipoprotein-anchoring transpeptidase ErfK/SrfK
MGARLDPKLAIVAALLTLTIDASGSRAEVVVQINLARQTMDVSVDGAHYATWAVSTARPGYRTPMGEYRPYALDRMHYSSLYDWTPMPHSIFFRRGFAIHGTLEIRKLGRPVSHGCVRLRPDNARALFNLVRRQGLSSTLISIH